MSVFVLRLVLSSKLQFNYLLIEVLNCLLFIYLLFIYCLVNVFVDVFRLFSRMFTVVYFTFCRNYLICH